MTTFQELQAQIQKSTLRAAQGMLVLSMLPQTVRQVVHLEEQWKRDYIILGAVSPESKKKYEELKRKTPCTPLK